jgi:hypothetical protein
VHQGLSGRAGQGAGKDDGCGEDAGGGGWRDQGDGFFEGSRGWMLDGIKVEELGSQLKAIIAYYIYLYNNIIIILS